LKELVWENTKDPEHDKREIHGRAEDPHIA